MGEYLDGKGKKRNLREMIEYEPYWVMTRFEIMEKEVERLEEINQDHREARKTLSLNLDHQQAEVKRLRARETELEKEVRKYWDRLTKSQATVEPLEQEAHKLKRLKEDLTDCLNENAVLLCRVIDRDDEIKRLEEALQEIYDESHYKLDCLSRAEEIAKKALEEEV